MIIVLSTNHNSSSSLVLVDNRQPQYCNSPGWERNPSNIGVLVGAYVYYQCKNVHAYNNTVWFLDGQQNILHTEYADRIDIQHSGKTLRFGPVIKQDDGIGINCEVYTKYGYLPSPLGIIKVISKSIQM